MVNGTTQLPPGQMAGTVLLYSQPEPLAIETHRDLKIKQSMTPYGFLKTTHLVPLQVGEFGPASLTYPIIFAGDNHMPLAIMSIRANENLFVNDEGMFQPDAYIPAYIRRYPFVLANLEGQTDMVVCIDRAAPMLTPEGDVPLFENGQASAFTQDAIKFLGDFEQERIKTESFIKILEDMDLFDTRHARYQPPAGPDGVQPEVVEIADFFSVTEEKLNKLSHNKLSQLRDSGALQQIYAQINSLFGWDKLIAKTLSLPPAAANQA